jgi:hypothetical protein
MINLSIVLGSAIGTIIAIIIIAIVNYGVHRKEYL